MQRLQALSSQISINQTSDLYYHINEAPADEIINTFKLYFEDKSPLKVNLSIGAYRDEEGNPYVFQAVRKVQNDIAQDIVSGKLNKEYSPIEGYKPFNQAAAKMVFGDDNKYIKNGCIATIQGISGSGALRIGMEFLKKQMNTNIYYPNPSWGNHLQTMVKAHLNPFQYTYYDPQTRGLNYQGMKNDIANISAGSIVLFHVCAHNPTGVDPTPEQWRELAQIVKQNKLIPFFDTAYQGFASGDYETDAYSIRCFLELDIQMLVAQSFSKNMGLYGERVGALHVVCQSPEVVEKVMSQLKAIIRPFYSSPPLQGARIAAGILTNPAYKEEWLKDMKQVSKRIDEMRILLKQELIKNKTPGNWDHITNQIGMFSYTGLNPAQCKVLVEKFHIYLIRNGRVSMTGVTTKNVKYIADAIKEVVETIK